MLTWDQLPKGLRWRRVTLYLATGKVTWAVGWPGVALSGDAPSPAAAPALIEAAIQSYGQERMWTR